MQIGQRAAGHFPGEFLLLLGQRLLFFRSQHCAEAFAGPSFAVTRASVRLGPWEGGKLDKMPTMRIVGIVQELCRYPVKSMAAQSLQTVSASWHGLAGDRRWAFIRPGKERSGFPWLTIREKPDLWRHEAYYTDSADVESAKTGVRTPDGGEWEVTDPELARHLGEGVRVIKVGSGIFDTFPLSLLTVQSVQGLSDLVGQTLSPRRFRPNLVIDASEGDPFPEERWEGAVLRIGGLRCRLDMRDPRCIMVNIDPVETTSTNPAVLRAIAQKRDAHFGMYGTVVQPGEVSVGDPVGIED